MSATARCAAGLGDLGHDADPAGGEGAAELAVAAHARRQRAGPGPLDAPEDQHLEGTVDGQRVGQPGLAERPVDPRRRRRGRRDPGGDPALAAALDALDALQVGAVEEHLAIDLGRVPADTAAGAAASIDRLALADADRPARPRRARAGPRGRRPSVPRSSTGTR